MNKAIELDQLDKKIAIGSGTLAGALDILYVSELSFDNAKEWGSEKINSFVVAVAKNQGYNGDDISGAVEHLKDMDIKAQDILGSSVSFGYEGIYAFADQLGIEGLIFSIFTYMTGRLVGFDEEGKFVCIKMEGFDKKSLEESIYWGTLRWMFNLIYAVVENSVDNIGNILDGEIPKAIRDIVEKLVEIPQLSEKLGKILEAEEILHDKDKLYERLSEYIYSSIEKGSSGLGTIIGIAHEIVDKKQYLPVAVNEIIVSSFYTASRLLWQIEINDVECFEDLKKIDIIVCLPYKNEALLAMRKLANTTFMSINIVKAGIKAATKCKNGIKDFGIHFLQNINYFGLVDWIVCFGPECSTYFDNLYEEFKNMAESQKEFFKDVLHKVNEFADQAVKISNTTKTIASMASPVSYVNAVKDVYDTMRQAYDELEIARENRKIVEAECAEHIMALKEYEAEMQAVITEYFIRKYTVFEKAFDIIDKAMADEDIALFISGQNMIQLELAGSVLFKNMDEFDDLMNSDDAIVF